MNSPRLIQKANSLVFSFDPDTFWHLKISAIRRIASGSLHHAASEVLSGLAVLVTCEHSKVKELT